MIKRFTVFLIFIIITGSAFSQSGWVWQNPSPQGNTVADMRFINQNTGYCVSPAGVVTKTTNSGLNWIICKTQLPSDLNALSVVSPNVLYVAGGNEVYKSVDGGLTWNMKQVSSSGYIFSVYFINESTGFLGGDQVILKTTNSGDNWAASNSYPNGSVNVIYFVDANTGFAAGGGFNIRKTTDSGLSWSSVFQESGIGAYLSMVFVNSNTGYIVGSGGRIRKTTDRGDTWLNLNSGTTAELYSISNYDTLNIAASGANGTIVKTSDGGTGWVIGNVSIQSLYGISFLNSSTLIAGGTMGMLVKSTDGGINWSFLSSGMYFSMYNSYFLNSRTGFITSDQGILKTSNAGANWLSKNTGEFRSVYFTDNTTGYAAGGSGNIVKTTDGGESWTGQNSGITTTLFSIHFVNQNTGFTGGAAGTYILRTSSGGDSWEKINIASYGQINDIHFINTNTGFMVTGNGKIMKSTNSGYNWTEVFSSSFGIIYEIDFGNSNTGFAVGGNKVITTTNGGSSWTQSTPATTPLLMEDIASVDFVNASTGYVGGLVMLSGSSEVAVCKTTNGGASWTMEFPGLKLNIYSICAISADTCFLTASNGGILRFASGLTSGSPVLNIMPAQYSLMQNYPNPFNPSTRIAYELPVPNYVRLTLYDILGKEIAVLVNEKQSAGKYSIQWDASNYTSGVYFYTLSTSDFTETKRMVLVK